MHSHLQSVTTTISQFPEYHVAQTVSSPFLIWPLPASFLLTSFVRIWVILYCRWECFSMCMLCCLSSFYILSTSERPSMLPFFSLLLHFFASSHSVFARWRIEWRLDLSVHTLFFLILFKSVTMLNEHLSKVNSSYWIYSCICLSRLSITTIVVRTTD